MLGYPNYADLSCLRTSQVPCNYGGKFVLDANQLYFSLDETKAYSGVYLVSIAKKRYNQINTLEGEPAAETEEPEPDREWESAEKEAEESAKEKEDFANKRKALTDKTKPSFTFPYHDRKVLFRADTFQEAIHLGDALVEKMIKSKTLLTS